jgi:hypothetical protein
MTEQATDNAATGSLLSGVEAPVTGQETAQEQVEADWRAQIPAKFRNGEEVNTEALVKSYLHLEKRMGSGDAPPEAADKYTLEGVKLPEGLQESDIGNFKEMAHKLKLSQAQANQLVEGYFEGVAPLMELAKQAPTPEKAEIALRQVWKDEKEYNNNLILAKKAFSAYAPEGVGLDDVGNNPATIQILAKLGAGMREDAPINQSAVMSQESVAEIMASQAYLNPSHPNYAATHAKVKAHYANKYPSK